MKHFFAVHIADIESEMFDRATPEQISTWLYLHAYCTKQFNGGAIDEADSINSKFWARHGIDGSVLAQESPLWAWDGQKLIVQPYDIEGEEMTMKKSEGGKLGAARRWGAKKNGSARGNPNGNPICTNQPNQPNQPDQPDQSTNKSLKKYVGRITDVEDLQS